MDERNPLVFGFYTAAHSLEQTHFQERQQLRRKRQKGERRKGNRKESRGRKRQAKHLHPCMDGWTDRWMTRTGRRMIYLSVRLCVRSSVHGVIHSSMVLKFQWMKRGSTSQRGNIPPARPSPAQPPAEPGPCPGPNTRPMYLLLFSSANGTQNPARE